MHYFGKSRLQARAADQYAVYVFHRHQFADISGIDAAAV